MNACLQVLPRRINCAAALVAAAFFLSACKPEAKQAENPPAMVRVETVTLTGYQPAVRLTGDIRARVESDLSFRVSGRIIERSVDVGDHVKEGQVLARLDPQQQEAAVTSAEAAVQGADAVLRQAASTFKRQKTLLAKGFTPQRAYDEAEEAHRTSAAALDAARAQLGTARDQLSHTVLRASAAGIITARTAETGQVVQMGQSVFALAQDGPRDAVFQVHELIFNKEPADAAIKLALVSNPAVTASGTVREVSPTVDESSGTIRVKVGIVNAPPEMTLGAAVIGESRFKPSQFVVIPWNALASGKGQPAVWTVDPQSRTAALKSITIESYQTEKIIVRAGLNPGDMVVTGGAQFLRPRQQVSYLEGGAL